MQSRSRFTVARLGGAAVLAGCMAGFGASLATASSVPGNDLAAIIAAQKAAIASVRSMSVVVSETFISYIDQNGTRLEMPMQSHLQTDRATKGQKYYVAWHSPGSNGPIIRMSMFDGKKTYSLDRSFNRHNHEVVTGSVEHKRSVSDQPVPLLQIGYGENGLPRKSYADLLRTAASVHVVRSADPKWGSVKTVRCELPGDVHRTITFAARLHWMGVRDVTDYPITVAPHARRITDVAVNSATHIGGLWLPTSSTTTSHVIIHNVSQLYSTDQTMLSAIHLNSVPDSVFTPHPVYGALVYNRETGRGESIKAKGYQPPKASAFTAVPGGA